MADKRPEARGEASGRHASKWGLRAGIGIELVEFLDGLEEFVRQADSGSADVGLQLRHAGRPDDGSPAEALAAAEAEGQYPRLRPVAQAKRTYGPGGLSPRGPGDPLLPGQRVRPAPSAPLPPADLPLPVPAHT